MEHQRTLFGQPVWLALVALGAAGVFAYLVFFRKSSNSSDATRTGYSSQGLAVMQNPDESATMALQNQELSELANQLGGVESSLTSQLTSFQQGTYTGLGQISSAVSQYGGQESDIQKSLAAYGDQLAAGQTALGGSLATLQNTGNASASATDGQYKSFLLNAQNYSNSLGGQANTMTNLQPVAA